MKKLLTLALLALLSWGAYAQKPDITRMSEIVEVESGEGEVTLSLFSVPVGDKPGYFLYVGTLGIGNAVIQFNVDPVNKLFLPLGGTLSESMETLQRLQEMYKEPGSSCEMEACFAPLVPDDSRETVRVTSRKVLLSRQLEFTLDRGDHLRSTSVVRSDFNTLMFALKGYQKLHPDE